MPKTLALILATTTLGAAACGGSGGASASHSATTGSSATAAATSGSGHATTHLAIAAAPSGALMFTTKTLHAKAGTVVITFTNHSSLGHDLAVVKGSNGAALGSTPVFSGGSKTLTLHLAAGTYTYFCTVPGHRQAGMQGTLTVSRA